MWINRENKSFLFYTIGRRNFKKMKKKKFENKWIRWHNDRVVKFIAYISIYIYIYILNDENKMMTCL